MSSNKYTLKDLESDLQDIIESINSTDVSDLLLKENQAKAALFKCCMECVFGVGVETYNENVEDNLATNDAEFQIYSQIKDLVKVENIRKLKASKDMYDMHQWYIGPHIP